MSAATIRRTSTGLLAGAMLLLVTACGSDSGGSTATDEPTATASSPSPTAAETSAAPEGPACADIWVEGAKLAKSYSGCVDDTGLVAPDKVGCSSGQTFVLYGDQFWAVKGGVVKFAEGGRTEANPYLVDMAACRG
jgi:hypothetical protein